jgi:Putative prokaryotic signal transducing protein
VETASRRVVTVYTGSPWEARLVESRLAAEGIQTFVPDANTRMLGPQFGGPRWMLLDVEVPASAAERAAAIVRDYLERTRQGAPGENGPGAAAARLDRLAKLGRRVRWASLGFVTAPIGVVLGLRYLNAASGPGPRPPHHLLTVLCAFASLLLFSLFVVLVYYATH